MISSIGDLYKGLAPARRTALSGEGEKMGTRLTLEIQDIGHRGVGIGRHQGKVVMVPFTAPGDTAEVEVVRSHPSYDQARLVRLVEPSPLRTSPPCPYFGLCGGCHLQHLGGARQRAIKERLFREALTRHAGVEETSVGPIIAAPEDLGYRSKIEMQRGPGPPRALGFMEWGSNKVIPVERCVVALPRINRLISEAGQLMVRTQPPGRARVEMACDESGDGATLTIWGRPWALGLGIHEELGSVSRGLRGVYVMDRRGVEIRPIWERAWEPRGILYVVPDPRPRREISLAAWPGVFRQANPGANRALVSKVLGWVQEARTRRVLDLYAGMGNLSIPVAFIAQEVTAVEVNPWAVENGRENCRRNGLDNVQWVGGSAKKVMARMIRGGESFDLLILDPPRGGAKELIEELIRLRPERIIYVSCDPATLARDLMQILGDGIYRVRESRPIDMFPQTFHLESVTLLEMR